MSKISKLFIILFISHFFSILNSSEDDINDINEPEEDNQKEPKQKKPKSWTTRKLYKYLNETYLHRNNPNYDENLRYMIFDPEYYCKYEEMQEPNDILKELSEKYNFSTHIFFISYIKDKHKGKSDHVYNAFVDRLIYLIYRDHKGYNEKKTLTAVFFIKDKKMIIRTTKELRKIFPDFECLNILNRRKKDLKAENYQEVARGIVKDIYKTYTRKTESPNANLILMFTVILIIGLTMVIFLLSREKSSPNEDKVKLFLDKLKKRNPKEIFSESCIICLGNYKSTEEIKNNENSEKKELLGNDETSVIECGHKFHRKCISDWLKKDESCPLCKMKFDIKRKDNSSKQEFVENFNFGNILTEILRIQANRNFLNNMEINRIRRIYHPYYRSSYNSRTSSSPDSGSKSTSLSNKKKESSFNKEE